MATHASSTTAPGVQHPRLLRGGGSTPRTVLTEADDIALAAEAPELPLPPLIPSSAPLPSLPAAFSRRRAIFGAVSAIAVTGCVPLSDTYESPPIAPKITSSDARLVDLASEYKAVEAAVVAGYAAPTFDEDDPAFHALLHRYSEIEQAMAETPADTLAGVLAKARVAQVRTCYEGAEESFFLSIADDLVRLHDAGVLA